MDIRAFMTKRRPGGAQSGSSTRNESDAVKTSKKRPKPIIESDSDDDFVPNSESKKTKRSESVHQKAKKEDKLEPTTPNDFFGSKKSRKSPVDKEGHKGNGHKKSTEDKDDDSRQKNEQIEKDSSKKQKKVAMEVPFKSSRLRSNGKKKDDSGSNEEETCSRESSRRASDESSRESKKSRKDSHKEDRKKSPIKENCKKSLIKKEGDEEEELSPRKKSKKSSRELDRDEEKNRKRSSPKRNEHKKSSTGDSKETSDSKKELKMSIIEEVKPENSKKAEKESPRKLEKESSRKIEKESSKRSEKESSRKIEKESSKKSEKGGSKRCIGDSFKAEKNEFKKASTIALPTTKPSTGETTALPSKVDSGPSLQWADKFKPQQLKQVIGQQGEKSGMNKLLQWLTHWEKRNLAHVEKSKKKFSKPPPWNSGSDDGAWAKAALLSGPPGIGKTTTAHLVAKQVGFDVVEMNASDTRSKKLMQSGVRDMLGSRSVKSQCRKMVLVMDEVDGMAGNEDRGGIAELIQLIKKSKVPVICICNDRNHQKIRSLANHCFDLRFQRPRVEQIKAAMLSVCFKEKMKVSPQYLTDLIVSCNQDIRQVLHHLSVMSASKSDTFNSADAKSAKKSSIKIGPFDVVRQVLSSNSTNEKSVNEKARLFFEDYSLGPLFVQENYLNAVPHAANGNRKQEMELASQAALCIALGDNVSTAIRSRNAWSLLPTQAIFSSVLPGDYMSGHLKGQIAFPSWFGKFSKRNKMDRMLMELQSHTRISSGASKRALNDDLLQPLRDAIVRPMKELQSKGVDSAFKVMQDYSLMREDLDNLLELTTWPGKPDAMKGIESKAKSAFTRLYNKKIVLPYATATAVVQKAKGKKVLASVEDDTHKEEEEQDEDNDLPVMASDEF